MTQTGHYTKNDLSAQIFQMGIDPAGTLLIHSSMKAIGKVERGAGTVLDAFAGYMRDGLLVFPTHTWHESNNKNNIYNPLSEPSCVGLLSNLFLKKQGVIRSFHPTHSVAALGKEAKAFVRGEEDCETPCPERGCYHRLYQRGAQVLFMGCSLKSNTLIHGVEEWNGIKDRLSSEPTVYSILVPGGEVIKRPFYRHSWPGGDISVHYGKLKQPLIYKGIAGMGAIGDAECIICDVVKMCDLTSGFLKEDPQIFAGDREIPQEWYMTPTLNL